MGDWLSGSRKCSSLYMYIYTSQSAGQRDARESLLRGSAKERSDIKPENLAVGLVLVREFYQPSM